MSTSTDLTIRKTVNVAVPPERAFAVFTDQLADWWPSETHSIAAMDGRLADRLELEWRVGAVGAEISGDERGEWWDVIAYEPPERLALRWRVNPNNPPTEVEVRFTAEGDGTRVDLEHRGWEAFADGEARTSYDGGWEAVLGRYVEHVNA
jgi:uncharacterized protein YndB with AHSA1/START domain